MDGYQLRTEKKKEKVRQAAIELFTSYGIEKVSLAEIAKKANVSPVTIYNHFGTKDELVKQVIRSYLQQEWEDRVAVTSQPGLSYPAKIERLIFETTDVSRKLSPDFLNALMQDEGVRGVIEELYREYIPFMIGLLEEGKREGYIDPSISNESIMAYLNILQNAMNQFEFSPDKEKNSKLAEDLSKMFFYGLLNRRDG
ncbi:TetR/AcrR family transcriptional regulator [Paenibacillus sambharensis]|uniref:TetR/AcrR family transcriptional regulator n=1 Tax=Paenibacillus sambharensis TaxID=1803190 RepID=UPI0015E87D48|nr:TetR/AcrR family transcriptional regulator [Paenibacillus sambharensis]